MNGVVPSPRERWAVAAALALVAAYVAPLFLLGEDAHIRIHDNLDSNIAWYRVLVRSGTWFGPPDAVIPQVMNGLPRAALGTEFSLLVALHAALPPMTAYAVSQTIVRVLAFFGMYRLLRDFIVREPGNWPVRVGVSALFALTPFWPSGMLSTLGHPLALWAFLHLRAGTDKLRHWAVIVLLPLYSSFVLGFFFFLFAIGIFWAVDAIRSRRWNAKFLLGIVLMTTVYLCVEYRLVLSLLVADEPTSRNEFVSSRLSFWRCIRLAVKNFVMGHNHVATLHTAVVLPATAIAALLCAAQRSWRREPEGRLILPLLAISAALSVWYAFWFHKGWQPLKETFPLLNTFNFARFHFLRPMLIYLGFACALSLFWRLGGKRGKMLAAAALAAQTAILGLHNDEIVYRHRPSFREFFAQEQFAAIGEAIGKPKEDYRVVSIGLHPAIAQFNGFYTLDSYNNFYPLAYKHRFREIIAKELEKNKQLRVYFDTWGGRCYVFVAELGKKYEFRKASKRKIKRLELNTEALYGLGGRYVLSALPIENAKANRLRFVRRFDDKRSAWRIYLYEIEPPDRR